jgi:hypothetical protein
LRASPNIHCSNHVLNCPQPFTAREKVQSPSRTRQRFSLSLTARWAWCVFIFWDSSSFNAAQSFAVATCLFFASVLSLTFPRILHSFGAVGAFGFYAGLNIVAFVMIFLLLPGTSFLVIQEYSPTKLSRDQTANFGGIRSRFRRSCEPLIFASFFPGLIRVPDVETRKLPSQHLPALFLQALGLYERA